MMPERQHLSLVILERFAESDLDPEQMIEAGQHLSACPSCRTRLRAEVKGGAAVLRRLARKSWPQEEAADYDQVFDRLQGKALDRIEDVQAEQESAPLLLDELSALPFPEQRRKVVEDARFHSAAVADLLLDQSTKLARENPVGAQEPAHLAMDIAEQLNAGDLGRVLANDLRARAWACLGNTHRILSDFRTAESELAKAEALLEQGSGDPLERARVLDFKASLLRSQKRFDGALATIDQVISIYRRIHDNHLQGRALISKAGILGYAGEQEKGVELFFRALALIDVSKEPRLALVALNNVLVDLVELGRYEEGVALLPQVHQLLERTGIPSDHIKIRWAEARLDLGLGRVAEAEAKLRRVRGEFVALGNGYNTALASLDLAKLYLEQGRTAETRQLAMEMHPIFASRDVHREALVALVFFQRAAEQERATVRLVEEVTNYLRRAQGNPGLPFEKPA